MRCRRCLSGGPPPARNRRHDSRELRFAGAAGGINARRLKYETPANCCSPPGHDPETQPNVAQLSLADCLRAGQPCHKLPRAIATRPKREHVSHPHAIAREGAYDEDGLGGYLREKPGRWR